MPCVDFDTLLGKGGEVDRNDVANNVLAGK